MGIPVMILGESGSGKSAALRNFSPEEICILSVAGKPLPFQKKLPVLKNTGYDQIGRTLKEKAYQSYAIDDSQYLLTFDSFARVNETGYGKFTDMAVRFYSMIQYVIRDLPEDIIVYFLHHSEQTETGKVKAKTLGKMLDSQLTVEGLFSIVLQCVADGQRHYFITQSDGRTTAKSPMELLPGEMDNDLKAVDTAIRTYYELNKGEHEPC